MRSVVAYFLLCSSLAVAQTPDWALTAANDGWVPPTGMTQDADGNIYVCGSYDQGPMSFGNFSVPYGWNFDGYVAKIDPNGTVLWLKRIGGTEADLVTDVDVDAMGNVYIIGQCRFGSTAQFGTFSFNPTGVYDGFLAKLSPTGSFLWMKNTVATSIASVRPVSIDVTDAGEIVVCGTKEYSFSWQGTSFSSYDQDDMFVARFNSSGILQWGRTFIGDDGDEEAQAVAFNDAGEVFVAGRIKGDVDLGGVIATPGGAFAPMVAKLSATGVAEWATTFGSTAFQGDGVGDLKVDGDGQVVICGWLYDGGVIGQDTLSTVAEREAYVASLSPTGNISWSRFMATSYNGYGGTTSASVGIGPENDIYVCGESLGDSTVIQGIAYPNEGAADVLVWRYSSSGNMIAHLAAGGEMFDGGVDIQADPFGYVVLSGYTYSNDLDFGSITLSNPNYVRNTFVVKFPPGVIGVPELATTSPLGLWPNPTQDELTVDGAPGDLITVRDINGRVLQTTTGTRVNVALLAAGVYLVEKRGANSFQVARFQKQ